MKTILLLCFFYLASPAFSQDKIYTWNGDSLQCRFITLPKKTGIYEAKKLGWDTYGFNYILAEFDNDSMRLIYPHEVAGIHVSSHSKFLLPGRYISMPVKNRSDYTKDMARKSNGGPNRFFRLRYENEAAMLLDLREHEHCIQFNYHIMRKKDSVITLIYSRKTLIKSLENLSIFPVKETKKYLKGKRTLRYSKYVVLMNRYRDYQKGTGSRK